MTLSVAEAYAACEAVTRTRAGNFWHGLRLTPRPERDGLFALYAWMREVDDLVDGDESGSAGTSVAERLRRLDEFAAQTELLLAGGKIETSPTWIALADAVDRWRLPAAPFRDMILGQRQDLDLETLPDWAALREFCRRVASTVGELCVRIWGLSGTADLALSESRGIAFQLTNILRDLREDRRRGRTYLPQEELRAAGLSIDDLLAWREPDRCLAFIRPQVERARRHYVESSPLDDRLRPACRPTLWAMTRIYSGILERLEADPAQVAGSRRVGLSTFRKVVIALEARRLGRRWAREPAAAP